MFVGACKRSLLASPARTDEKSAQGHSTARHSARRAFRRGSTRRAIGHAMFASPQRQGGDGAFGSGNAPAEEGGSGTSRRRGMSAKTSLTIPARPISDAAFPPPPLTSIPQPPSTCRRPRGSSPTCRLRATAWISRRSSGRVRARRTRSSSSGCVPLPLLFVRARASARRGNHHRARGATCSRFRDASRACRRDDVHSTRPLPLTFPTSRRAPPLLSISLSFRRRSFPRSGPRRSRP